MPTTGHQPEEVWNSALGQLQLKVTRPSFETWLKNTVGVSHQNGEFTVGAPNTFVAEMLEQRMYSLISRTLEAVLESDVSVRFTVDASDKSASGHEARPDVRAETPVEAAPRAAHPSTMLNQKYTFEKFVVGKSNELAHAAAVAVAEKPGQLYNPLVMYSQVGLGKTHLMHAIGHRVSARGIKLIYSTTEEFTNSYVKAIREGTTEQFRDRFRTADVLLLDDIQFLIGKEQTQEGFFHTFNALHMSSRQIVITSDRPVTALTLLEDRIQSRLAGGLVVDIQPPDIETRIAIVSEKAKRSQQSIPEEVIHFLAERIHRNVRELEGSLNKVVAMADLMNTPVTIELVKRVIAEVVGTAAERQIPESVVIDTVAAHFRVSVDALKGRKRDKKTAQARQVAMYLLQEESELGFTAIGRVLGGKDHTTVMHGCTRIANQLIVDPQLRRSIINIKDTLSKAS